MSELDNKKLPMVMCRIGLVEMTRNCHSERQSIVIPNKVRDLGFVRIHMFKTLNELSGLNKMRKESIN